MAWLNFVKKEKENPFFTKLKRVLSKDIKLESIRSIYYLGGFEYSKNGYEKARAAILSGNLNSFLKSISYNVQQDNIELYLMDFGLRRSIVMILDPVELYQRETVLDTFQIEEELELSSAEKIYSN
jgi:hypothetical protein